MPETNHENGQQAFNQASSVKNKALNFGLYLIPFVYALVLIRWGNLLPTWSIIAFASVVAGIFLLAGFLHFREQGKAQLIPGLDAHPIRYLLAAMILSGLVVGTGTYLIVRAPRKPPTNNTASEPPRPTPITREYSPSAHSSAPPTPKGQPHIKPNLRKRPAPETSRASPSVPPIRQQPQVNCEDAGNCAAVNQGQQIFNQYNAPEPIQISPSQAQMITDELRKYPGLSGTVKVRYEIAVPDGAESAQNLAEALTNAGIAADSSGAIIEMDDCNPTKQFPGLYFDCMTENNSGLANAIALALRVAKVTNGKIHGLRTGYPNATLVILIRKQ